MTDLVIRGGVVIDGTGAPGRRADLAVSGGRIEALGDAGDTPSAEVIDATGLVVSPGFIDTHAHSDAALIHDPLDHSFICHESDPLLAALQMWDPTWNVVDFPFIPTAENIARWCWDQLDEPITERFRDGLQLAEVAVWETPTSVAYYHGS